VTLRVPLGGDQTLQVEFHEIERRLRALEGKVLGVSRPGVTSTLTVIGGAATNLQPIEERLSSLETIVAELEANPEVDVSAIPVFGAVGSTSAKGLVLEPGQREPPTGLAEHVLKEDATWGFPYRGLVRVATPGTQTEPPSDVVNVHGSLSARHLEVSDIECYNLHVHGDIEYSDSFYDDVRVDIISTRVGASTYQPTWTQVKTDGAGSRGVYAYAFHPTNENEVFFELQLPHAWKEGSPIWPHIHWAPVDTDTGSVVWGLEYTKATVGDAYGNTTTLSVTDPGDGTAYKHQIAVFSSIDMTGDSLSTVLICRLFRDAGNGSDD